MNTKDYTSRLSTPDDVLAVELLLQASYPQLMAHAYEQAILVPTLKLITKANPSLLASGTYYVAEASDGTIVECGG